MSWFGQIFSRRRRFEELSESMREHLSERVEELVEGGMARADAEFAAKREFGNMTRIEERSREVWQWPRIESVWADVKYALRQAMKAPGFAAVVIITLALGIGANTTVFSIVDAVMLRPLPYAQPQRLVEVQSSGMGSFSGEDVSYPDFLDWRRQNRSFERLVSYHGASFTLTGMERAVHLDGQVVSWDLLPLLGVQPELGRGFTPVEERRGSRVVLISHALWVSQFGSDPSVVGRTMHLSGDAFTIAGVMPATFRFPVNAPKNDFWTTLAIDDDASDHHPAVGNRGMHFLNVIGRLKPGVTVAQADAEMKAMAARLAKQYPDSNTTHDSARAVSELTALLGDTRTLLMVVLGAVALVLLIACGNVANLLLARSREREREMAMRSALGANRGRIVRQLLVESVTLGIAGGVAGCALAFLATPAVLRLMGTSVPRAADAGVSLPVLGFVLFVSLVSGVLFGLVPAVSAAKADLLSTLKEGGRGDVGGHHRVGSAVIVGQVALGIVLTAGAGLLMTSFVKLTHKDEGFNPDHLLMYNFETPDSRYTKTRPEFYGQYFEKLRALPGVQSAAGSMLPPMTNNDAILSFENPEHPVPEGQEASANVDAISPGYFRTMQIPLLMGRDFSDGDDLKSTQVMIVNQAFAEKYFHGENPLGKKLKPGAGNGTPEGPPWREIVGVVGNIRASATEGEMEPIQYLAANQLARWCCMRTVVRTSVDPMSLEPEVRMLVSSMDRDIPVTDVSTMRDLTSLQLAQPRFAMVLVGAFAGLALVLTVVGLYGVMAYSVARRTREIGVRLALGAQRGAVLNMVLRDAAVLVGVGMAMGIAATLASASVLQSMLYGTGSRNPLVLAGVCAVVAMAGLVAAYLPALRAAGVDPMQALRSE
jgi:putative ABC transport system permease protein